MKLILIWRHNSSISVFYSVMADCNIYIYIIIYTKYISTMIGTYEINFSTLTFWSACGNVSVIDSGFTTQILQRFDLLL